MPARARCEPSLFDDPKSIGHAVKPKRPTDAPITSTVTPGMPRARLLQRRPQLARPSLRRPRLIRRRSSLRSLVRMRTMSNGHRSGTTWNWHAGCWRWPRRRSTRRKFQRLFYERAVEYAANDKDGASSATALAALAGLQPLYAEEAAAWDDRASRCWRRCTRLRLRSSGRELRTRFGWSSCRPPTAAPRPAVSPTTRPSPARRRTWRAGSVLTRQAKRRTCSKPSPISQRPHRSPREVADPRESETPVKPVSNSIGNAVPSSIPYE
jgi:hypothetical protein